MTSSTTENIQIEHLNGTASLELSNAPVRFQSNTIFWLRLAAQGAFGCLIILDSLYLVLCYITFDFFGCLNNPFFVWLRWCGFLAWILYFPLFLGALVGIDVGQQTKRSRRLAAIFLLAQIVTGFTLFFLPGFKSVFGWSMLYGPNVRTPMGEILSYVDAITCLLPLLWISITHVATAFPAARRKRAAGTWKLSSFLMAALVSSLLYSIWANSRLAAGGQPLSMAGLAFSVAAHLGIFAALFLVLQWISVVSNHLPDPGMAQFAMTSMGAWLLLTFLLRQIIFPLLAFNNYLADLYAVAFSLTAVLFAAGLILKIRERRAADGSNHHEGFPKRRLWPRRALILSAAFGLFYLFVTRLAAIEWEHIIGSLVALGIWGLLLWFFLGFARRTVTFKGFFLTLLSVGTIAGLAGARFLLSSSRPAGLAASLEQYSDYDPSFFAIRQALKPAVHDDAYDGFYRFLSQHANIRVAASVPEITLTGNLKPTSLNKPNIFVFVIDALRRDYVSSYNSAVTFTPAIDAFAHDSVVFQNAYTFYAGTALAEPAIWAGFEQLHAPYRPFSSLSSLQRMLDVDGFHSYISYDEVLRVIVPASANVTVLNNSFRQSSLNEFGAVVTELEDDLQQPKEENSPIFVYAQPANVHTLSLALHGENLPGRPHPGFHERYASAVEQVDATFGKFIAFLKSHHLYENSIIIVTADHGESLGEMGRQAHVANLTPEVIRIPLIIHLPQSRKTGLVWNADAVTSLHDITPTLYYLLGHRPIRNDPMLGHPLFTLTQGEQTQTTPDHYFLMSSYMPVFGILSGDQKSLFMVDANLRRNFYYNLEDDPKALKNRITVPLRDHYEAIIRKDLANIDKLYGQSE